MVSIMKYIPILLTNMKDQAILLNIFTIDTSICTPRLFQIGNMYWGTCSNIWRIKIPEKDSKKAPSKKITKSNIF